MLGSLLSFCLIAAACTASNTTSTTSAPPPSAASSTTTVGNSSTTTQAPPTTVVDLDPPGLVGALPTGACDGIGSAPEAEQAEVTFVIDGRLYASNTDGSNVRCLTEGPFPRQWAGNGDRLLIRAGDGALAAIDESGPLPIAVRTRFEGESWTRPSGTSVVGIAEDGLLLKYPIDGGDPVDLSFLARHDEVVYHPAGTHVIVVGESADSVYGIWLATNIGTEPELLIEGTSATLSSASISHDGLNLQFLADHGDESHVHQVFLPDASSAEFDASIALLTNSSLANLVVSPFGVGELAVAEGTCGADLHTVLPYWPETEVLPGMESRPVGFLPGEPSDLVVAAYPDLCTPGSPVDLYIVDVAGAQEPVLLVGGVDAFALPGVRARLPDPPPPPGEFNFDDFA